MAKNAGDYYMMFSWKKWTITPNATYGNDVQSWPDHQDLYGYLENISATKIDDVGVRLSETNVKIHIRNFPAIDPKDRLRDKRTCVLYVIDGIVEDWSNNELIITAHSRRENEAGE